jgi:hypothetical protein
MAKTARQKAFDAEFRGHVERFTPKLVPALRRITSATPPPVVKIQLFVIQSDWGEFPVHAFAMDDASPDEVSFKRPFYGKVLKGREKLVPQGAIDQDAYEDAGVDTFESGARVLAEWFGECWESAGGSRFPIPAYIHHHDRPSYYDLRRKRWVKESQVWK